MSALSGMYVCIWRLPFTFINTVSRKVLLCVNAYGLVYSANKEAIGVLVTGISERASDCANE